MQDWDSWYDQENIQAVIEVTRKSRGEDILAHPSRFITYMEDNKPLNMARVRLDNNQASQIYVSISPPQRGHNITPTDFQTAMQSEAERLLKSNRLNAAGKKQAFIFQAHIGDNHWATYACNTEGEIMAINSMDGYQAWDNAAIKAFKAAFQNNNITPKPSINITPRESKDFSQQNSDDCGPITAAISCQISGEESFSSQANKLKSKMREFCRPDPGLRDQQKNSIERAKLNEKPKAPVAQSGFREHGHHQRTSYTEIISRLDLPTAASGYSPKNHPAPRSNASPHSHDTEILAVAVTVDLHRSMPDGTPVKIENLSEAQEYTRALQETERHSTIHLSVSSDRQIKSFDLRADTEILNTFIKDKNILMLSGGNGFIYKLDATSPQQKLEQIGGLHKSYVTSVGSLKRPGEKECCISSSANSVYLWDKEMKKAEIITIPNCNKVITSVVGLNNGCIACVDRLGSIFVIDAEKNVHTIEEKFPTTSAESTGKQVNLSRLSINQQGKLVQHDKEGTHFDESIEDKIDNYFKKLDFDLNEPAETFRPM